MKDKKVDKIMGMSTLVCVDVQVDLPFLMTWFINLIGWDEQISLWC